MNEIPDDISLQQKNSKIVIETEHTTPLYVFGFLLQVMPLNWQPAIPVFSIGFAIGHLTKAA